MTRPLWLAESRRINVLEVVAVTNENLDSRSAETTSISVKPVTHSSRRLILIAVVLAVLIVASGTVFYLVTTHRNGENYAGSANDALVVGLTTSHSVEGIAHRVGVAGELVNGSPLTLEVHGPIRISGTDVDSGVHVLYAQLVEDSSVIAGVPTDAPPQLTAVSPREHVTAAVGLEIDCSRWSARSEWPSAQTTATIGLAGFDTPATFSFPDLFGTEVAAQIREMCAHT